jgi:hypothetical protein
MLVRILERKRPLGKLQGRMKDNIKMDLGDKSL